MADGIFLLTTDRQLVPMAAEFYDSEDLLQKLIADYPDLLAGEQMDQQSPRRWLLVKREMPVPSEEDGTGRWSLDHLLLDQDAIPTLVEVKRSTDTRIRREVVGQMLDYAANGVVYWPIEEVRACFDRLCENQAIDPNARLAEFLCGAMEPEQFWTTARTNLQAGRIRLVFVADVIPSELRRIVEFLNEQMTPAEVLAVEIKQYVGQGMRTLVPRVFGGTQAAEAKKGVSKRTAEPWNEERFFATLSALRGQAETRCARQIYDWAVQQFGPPSFGSGTETGTYVVEFEHDGHRHVLCDVSTPYPISRPEARNKPAVVAIRLGRLRRLSAFADDALQAELLRRLNAMPGVQIPSDAVHPNFPLTPLLDEAVLRQFLDTLQWVAEQIRARG